MRFLKKLWASLLAAFLIIPIFQQTTAQAATPISIYIDGSRLTTDQAPVVISGRVMLPLRAIFEALDATVNYNQTLQTVTAQKDSTTIVLKLKSRSATINNEAVLLDVPAQSIKGRTMVPVRFVSEALGQQVGWNNTTKIVTISSGTGSGGTGGGSSDPSPVAYVSARDVGNNGDGRDLEISFSKSSNESRVEQYRVMLVKATNASAFNLTAALKVGSANYTSLSPSGTDPVVNLSASARDVDGSAIRENQSYVAYVLVIGKGNSANSLSNPSPSFTLSNGAAVAAPTNVKVSDVSDYGDGRDLNVTFTRASNESNIANYRVFVVKTKDAGSFTLSTANNVPSSYSTVVSKSGSGSTLTGQLTSTARDTSGDLIKNSVSYTVFVQSVSNNSGYANKLSTASSAITLATGSVIAPVITKVEDWNDYGDGRDLRVSFNRISDETRIGSYRIFVVKASDYANFSLSKANAVSQTNYTQVNKTGSNITSYALSSSARDVNGATIRNDVSYRVFVMAVGTGNYAGTNTLSAASGAITLTRGNMVDIVSNVTVEDVNDNNDGRDLRVSFTRASNETYISSYRIMVVKTSDAGNFTLAKANNVGSANYTTVNKNGYTLSTVLSSGARDVDGATIRNGISYRVFVLSVAANGYNLSNALSYYSSPITLSYNAVGTVSNLTAADVSDYGDGRDLYVSFNRAADETNISHYRVMVVKSANAGSFNLTKANAVPSDRYTYISKGNYTLTGVLAAGAKDVDGAAIKNGVSYRVFVLSAGHSGTNALSLASNVITLSGSAVGAASNVTANDVNDYGDGRDLRVSFTRASNETYISQYRVFVVKASKYNSFDLNAANASNFFTALNKNGATLTVDLTGAKDTDGEFIRNGVAYRVYVLSVAVSGGGSNALSVVSNEVTLNNSAALERLNVSANVTGGRFSYSDIVVSFNKQPNENHVQEYRIMVVPAANVSSFSLEYANTVTLDSNFTTVTPNGQNIQVPLNRANTVYGTPLDSNTTYHVFVLTVATPQSGLPNVLSGPSGQVKLEVDPSTVPVPAASIVSATANGTNIDVNFNKANEDQNIDKYLVIAVPSSGTPAISDTGVTVAKQGPYSVSVNLDHQGNPLDFQSNTYNIYVISLPDKSKSTNFNITGPTPVAP
ncbi:MAG: copper amine oxidase N-terminal domain-containing protein [Paenibacillus sp.]|uniref:copper amine oxidase N-terminal domain-containing protein n=1 Tax=Paenibacillus sp. TaxID=58172 RepID=UPI00290FDC3F|nr:copper amine oxidase N-terminal domain-containing protein [Paenibacillus sp.]MDU4694375.1 copper amine oxidase N-terminal domain-containing protein [Paenibacillus sp.]